MCKEDSFTFKKNIFYVQWVHEFVCILIYGVIWYISHVCTSLYTPTPPPPPLPAKTCWSSQEVKPQNLILFLSARSPPPASRRFWFSFPDWVDNSVFFWWHNMFILQNTRPRKIVKDKYSFHVEELPIRDPFDLGTVYFPTAHFSYVCQNFNHFEMFL